MEKIMQKIQISNKVKHQKNSKEKKKSVPKKGRKKYGER